MLSLNITYYNEPKWLQWWYNTVKRVNSVYGINLSLNIADDGSQKEPAEQFFIKNPPTPDMRLFVITEDLGFNSHGARNLLMKHTQTDWNLLSDIDRSYSDKTLLRMYDDHKDVGCYYVLVAPPMIERELYTVNDYVVHTRDFWRAGGYDEEFVNAHYGDRDFMKVLGSVAKRVVNSDWEVKFTRFARKTVIHAPLGGVKTTQYPDDDTMVVPDTDWNSRSFRTALIKEVRARNSRESLRRTKQIINFPWKQVF